MDQDRQGVQVPPHSNTGGKSPEGEILIDALSFTVLRADLESVVGGSTSLWTESADQVVGFLNWFLFDLFGTDVFAGTELKGGRNFFDHSLPLGAAGFIAFGGNNKVQSYDGTKTRTVAERVQVYLTGEGCALVPDWPRLAQRLEELQARITRVDLAYDDHAGERDVDHCRSLYDAGDFTSSGRPPKANLIDDLGSGEGRTFYVGKRQNGKMLRCYEKGKQLGDEASPWVRWEVELHAKDRVIPYDVLTDPQSYLAGSYPALSFINEICRVIKTAKIKLSIQYTKLSNICRTQYGKLLNFAHQEIGLTPEQTFYELLNPKGYPERLAWASG